MVIFSHNRTVFGAVFHIIRTEICSIFTFSHISRWVVVIHAAAIWPLGGMAMANPATVGPPLHKADRQPRQMMTFAAWGTWGGRKFCGVCVKRNGRKRGFLRNFI